MIQRAILLNRILKDCYGPQELIHSQWLPPALVFGQSRFLRSCHGIEPAGGTFLHFYAADVARGPDGRWWVLSDRTQVPAGAGYALANRLVASRVFPAAFRSQHVHRLAGFFKERRLSLAGLATQAGRDAHVVLLSPGANHETYFEHSYLARYMGYLLVEGEDLTVRDDRVFLKTLSGLEPVDVIIRRVKDNLCDPLELRNDSTQGIPGLLEAVRAGNITIANALGSGLAEAPAFLSFLPGLCRHLLGEELQIPSVGTWWCGQQAAADHVLANLDALSIQDAFKVRPNMMEYDGELSDEMASNLKEQNPVSAHPVCGAGTPDAVARAGLGWQPLRGATGDLAGLPGGLRRQLSADARRAGARGRASPRCIPSPCARTGPARTCGW